MHEAGDGRPSIQSSPLTAITPCLVSCLKHVASKCGKKPFTSVLIRKRCFKG